MLTLILTLNPTSLISPFTLDPYELGELYWSANVVLNQAFCFVSVYLYDQYSEESSEEVAEVLWKIVSGLFVFSMLNFSGFLLLIYRAFIKTFFSPITGKQFAVLNSQEAETDDIRFQVFAHHVSYYEVIQWDVMKWLNENWSNWEETSPEWFTAEGIAKVPSYMLPVHVLKGMGGISGRKASIAAMEENAKKPVEERGVVGNDLKIKPAAT